RPRSRKDVCIESVDAQIFFYISAVRQICSAIPEGSTLNIVIYSEKIWPELDIFEDLVSRSNSAHRVKVVSPSEIARYSLGNYTCYIIHRILNRRGDISTPLRSVLDMFTKAT